MSTEQENQLDSSSHSTDQETLILQPFHYLSQVPGKGVRGRLMVAFNQWFKVEEKKLQEVGKIVQMLHTSSLLIDDIEDNSILRRGIPVAHKVYGVPSTINCANYVMFKALDRCLHLGHPKAVEVFNEQMLELHRGQGMEIYWRDNFTCPTEEEYNDMTVKKTGGLFNLAVRLLHLCSPASEDLDIEPYALLLRLLGLYFQIRDDYSNLVLEEYANNKSFAEDLTEGKFSFPIIYAIRKNPSDTRLLSILRQRPTDLEVKKYAVKLLDECGAFQHTHSVLTTLDNDLRVEVARLGGNDYLIKLLDDLANWKTVSESDQ